MSERLRTEGRLLPVLGVIAIVFGLAFAHNATLIQAGTYAAIYAIAVLGLSLLLGNVAQVSIGQAGFFAIGAYAVGYLSTSVRWPAGIPLWLQYVVATAVAVALSTAFGLLLGFIALRFRGHYLAMSTLTFGLIVVGIIRETPGLGGANGLNDVPYPQFGPVTVSGNVTYWYVLLVCAAIAALNFSILRGRTGRAFEAIRNDELAAEVVGVPTRRYKILAFAYAAALAGLAGSLYASYLGLVVPDAVGVQLSIDLLLMTVLGGAGSIAGAIVGAAVIGITNIYGHSLENLRPVIYGVAVIAIVILLPRGLVGLVPGGRRSRAPVATATARAPAEAALPATVADDVPWLEVRGVSKRFGGLVAVDDVSFTLRNASLTSLIGPNGAGKTTLFNAICGVGRADGGRVLIGGHDVTRAQPHEIVKLGVARSFQNARLFGEMTVLENVLTGAFAQRSFRLAEAREVLATLGLTHLAGVYAKDLAFGDRRRVELARAVAGEPRLLLLDEPAAGLNAGERLQLREDLLALRDRGLTLLLIEHDMRLVMEISERVMVLEFGKMIADGRPQAVQNDPAVVAAYLGVAS